MTREVAEPVASAGPLAQHRLPGLDGVRAIAVLLVIGFHLSMSGPLHAGLITTFFRNGDFGVNVFFAVSGLIITWLLLQEEDTRGAISWKNFYARRAARILPPAFVYLAVISVASSFHGTSPAWSVIASAFFYRNLIVEDHGDTAHFWTLAVEEQFYLVWPLLFLLLRPSVRLPFLVGLFATLPFWRRMNEMVAHGTLNTHRADLQADYLVAGYLLACLLRNAGFRRLFGSRLMRSDWIALGAAAILIETFIPPAARLPLWIEEAYTPLRAICVAVLLQRVVRRTANGTGLDAMLNVWPLTMIGRLSYSLYLWQQPFCMPFGLFKTSNRATDLLATCACAAASYVLVERPVQKLRRRLRSRTAGGLATQRIEQEPTSSIS